LLFDYTLNNKILLRRSSVQDLGVLFDSKLSFCDHILSITSAAFKSQGFVLRSAKQSGDVVTLKLLYITYVRSKLEYASLVWSLIHNIYIAQLERVQRRFLKSTIFMSDGLYPPRGYPQELLLDRLGLQSLSNRRLEHSVIFLYKLLHGSLHCPALLSRVNLRVPRSGSRSTNTFLITPYRTDAGLRSPVTQMLRGHEVVEMNVDIFACRLNQVKSFFRV
jgi:hypothetical protein